MERDEQLVKPKKRIPISTHTLTWSVTFSCYTVLIRDYNFNSHAHVERDWRCILLWCAL